MSPSRYDIKAAQSAKKRRKQRRPGYLFFAVSSFFIIFFCWAGLLLAASPAQSLAEIQTAATQFAEQQMERKPDEAISIHAQALDERLQLMQCSVPLTAFMPMGQVITRQSAIGVRCLAPVQWTIYVPVKVERIGPVLVANQYIPRDNAIAQDVVSVVLRDRSTLQQGYFTAISQLNGQVAKIGISSGQVILPQQLSQQVVIKRGEQVHVLASLGTLKVEMMGIALGDGRIGGVIPIRNLKSQKVVDGVVLGPGKVAVGLS